MTRDDNWRAALSKYISAVGAKPFKFGEHDCALFAAGAIEAMTGEDIAASFRGYTSEIEGLMKVKRAGYDSHVDVFRLDLDPTEDPQTGDIAVVEGFDGMTVGVVVDNVVIVAGRRKLERVAVAEIQEAFAV